MSTGILASAAASSPLVRAALGSGAADTSSIMAATIAVVKSQVASGALAAAVAAQPAVVTGLGYSSAAQLVAQLALDGAPIARAPPAAPTSPGGASASSAIIGAVVGVLTLAVCGFAGCRFAYAPARSLKTAAVVVPSESDKPSEEAPKASPTTGMTIRQVQT